MKIEIDKEWHKEDVKAKDKMISSIGINGLKRIVALFEENNGKPDPFRENSTYGYWQAVREQHIEHLKVNADYYDEDELEETIKYLRK